MTDAEYNALLAKIVDYQPVAAAVGPPVDGVLAAIAGSAPGVLGKIAMPIGLAQMALSSPPVVTQEQEDAEMQKPTTPTATYPAQPAPFVALKQKLKAMVGQ